jgi:exodeoxyribonuclease V alpha subunit
MTSGNELQLSGIIDAVISAKPESGWGAMRLKVDEGTFAPYKDDRGRVTIVGGIASLAVGQRVSVSGEITRSKYGPQLQVTDVSVLEPQTVTEILKYLTHNVYSVGPKTARAIVDTFGMDTFKILDDDLDRLYDVPGIDKVRAEGIKKAWDEKRAERKFLQFATRAGITGTFVSRILREYGDQAEQKVSEDPYCLCRDIKGIGFKKADEIAIHLGLAETDIRRVRACALFVLQEASSGPGECFLYRQDLIRVTHELLNHRQITVEDVDAAVSDAAERGIVIDDSGRIYDPKIFNCETKAAEKLLAILSQPMPPELAGDDLDAIIEGASSSTGLTLDPVQIEAIDRTLRSKLAVLTGGPGTCKTTITRALVAGYERAGLMINMLAPTGRAAKRMSEVIGRYAETIHRRLHSLSKMIKDGAAIEDVLMRGVLIIDEVSMVDIEVLAWLLSYVHPSCIVIFVGDADQLPSVGPGSVLRDLLGCPKIAATKLTKPQRQAVGSDIVRHAHDINNGVTPQIQKVSREIIKARGWPKTDMMLIECDDQEKQAAIVRWCVSKLVPAFGFNPAEDVQVLSPMKKGAAGVENLNKQVQDVINPNPEDSIDRFGTRWGSGDRMMNTRNNRETGLCNGDQGRIVRFERNAEAEVVKLIGSFDGQDKELERVDWNDLMLAYACTVHKSQGSEYPVVIMCLHTGHFKMLQRNMLYTGVTRSRKLVILVAHPQAVSMAVRNNQVSKRNTYLMERLTNTVMKLAA